MHKGTAKSIDHIGSIDGTTVTPVGVEQDAGEMTTTVGELVELYQVVDFRQDLVVQKADVPPLGSHAAAAHDAMASTVQLRLYEAARLHQPKLDLQLKGNGVLHLFAAADYQVGQLQPVPFSTDVKVVLEKDARKQTAAMQNAKSRVAKVQSIRWFFYPCTLTSRK